MNGFLKDPADLNALTFIPKQAVIRFAQQLNDVQTDKTLVAAIGTGGTISMKIEKGIRVPDLDFQSILKQAAPSLDEDFTVIGLDAFRIDSSQMTYAHVRDMVIVMTYVHRTLDVPFAGFLVLHGTDTMAFSAATTSLMTGQGLPFSVVFTGAQKSIQEKMRDAAQNLSHALYTLEALSQKNMAEVVIAMGDYAILGTSAVKVNDILADAFDAPMHHYVANFSALEYPIRLAAWLKPRRSVPFHPTVWGYDYSSTLLIHSSLGLLPERIKRQVQDDTVRAVLLFSYGAGTVDEKVAEAILQPAHEKDIPVFVVNPMNTDFKIAYSSAQRLVEQGVIPLTMTLPSALAKIEIALGFHAGNKSRLAEFMQTNYVGEIPNEASRFIPVLER